jgi:hypothetical protein
MIGTINVYDVQLPKTTFTPFKSFVPFGVGFRGGVNISAVNPQTNGNITAPMIVASQAASGTGQVIVLNGLTGATRYTTTFGVNNGVRTASKLIGGRFYVFAAVPVSGHPSKIVRIDPLAPSMVDFILETDPAFTKMFLG